jgi:hypothetical protein
MTPERQAALAGALLMPPPDWPWQWAPEGDAIVWQDGETVALREEVALIVERLLPSGVPSFGPLVLLLSACRGKVLAESDTLELLQRAGGARNPAAAARAQLLALAAMPRPLLASVPAKTSLASLVLAGAPKMSAEEAAAALAFLQGSVPYSAWILHRERGRLQNFPDALRELQAGLAPLDAGQIEHALRTGLAEPPAAAEVELPTGESIRALLRELESDPELAGLSRLVRDVMAAVVLPRALPRPDHDSPGGFSDIGNRGSLHRLLLSELAHEDDTLAARIALGEALYLRREPAANPPPTTLALLLDAGLRMWGTPRVFGTAVALACLAKAPPGHAVETFRARETQAEPVSLGTRAGLMSHLAALETMLDPAAALASLVAKLQAADRQLDVIVITHPLTLADPAFHAACLAHREVSLHAATVDRDGAFALALCTAGGWQPLAGARLRLESLFSVPARPSIRRSSRTLPALLRREEPVFLLPLPRHPKGICEAGAAAPPEGAQGDAAVAVAHDGSLWQWNPSERRGALRLPGVKLAGEFCDLLFDRSGPCVIAIGHESRGHALHLVRKFGGLETCEAQSETFPSPIPRPMRIWIRSGHLFLGSARQVHVINIRTGAVVADATLPGGLLWLNDRWLTDPSQADHHSFVTPAFTGTQVVFERLGRHQLLYAGDFVYLSRREESEEVWGLDAGGRFFDLETGAMRLDPGLGPLSNFEASRDGRRLLARDRHEQIHLIHLPSGEKRTRFHPREGMASVTLPPAWSVRTRFTHICPHPSGRLWLRSARSHWLALTLKEPGGTFTLERISEEADRPGAIEFGPPEAMPEHGCTLAPAEFRNGGRAWLDSRGMLHLEPADLFLPELSFILAESSSLPAWSSDGMLVGPAYFLRRPALGSAAQIERHLRSFVSGCL